jgi:hypothetical protein
VLDADSAQVVELEQHLSAQDANEDVDSDNIARLTVTASTSEVESQQRESESADTPATIANTEPSDIADPSHSRLEVSEIHVASAIESPVDPITVDNSPLSSLAQAASETITEPANNTNTSAEFASEAVVDVSQVEPSALAPSQSDNTTPASSVTYHRLPVSYVAFGEEVVDVDALCLPESFSPVDAQVRPCTYARMHVCTYACTHVCTCACMHIHQQPES